MGINSKWKSATTIERETAANMDGQDWNPVVMRKYKPGGAAAKPTPVSMSAAMRAGNVEQVKKYSAGNKNSAAHANAAKLDADTENLTHQKVSSELKKLIMQARTAKKMTQAQLAQAINEKPQTVQEYEQGKAIPNNQILGKMERALGVKLSGSGAPKKIQKVRRNDCETHM